MGTRGFVGFVADDHEVIVYNHFDSYPDGLGVVVLEWVRGLADLPEKLVAAREAVLAMRPHAGEDDRPTPEDIERLQGFADWDVSNRGGPAEWYQLLRDTQGKPQAILEAVDYEDAKRFPQDSLFCEWGYLVDFDKDTFEVYRGFQDAPHEAGRFAARDLRTGYATGQYYPVKLIGSWPINALPSEEDLVGIDRSDEEGDEE